MGIRHWPNKIVGKDYSFWHCVNKLLKSLLLTPARAMRQSEKSSVNRDDFNVLNILDE